MAFFRVNTNPIIIIFCFVLFLLRHENFRNSKITIKKSFPIRNLNINLVLIVSWHWRYVVPHQMHVHNECGIPWTDFSKIPTTATIKLKFMTDMCAIYYQSFVSMKANIFFRYKLNNCHRCMFLSLYIEIILLCGHGFFSFSLCKQHV